MSHVESLEETKERFISVNAARNVLLKSVLDKAYRRDERMIRVCKYCMRGSQRSYYLISHFEAIKFHFIFVNTAGSDVVGIRRRLMTVKTAERDLGALSVRKVT